MSLLAVTRAELIDIRKAFLAQISREEGSKEKVSDALRIINAILDKNIEVIPMLQDRFLDEQTVFSVEMLEDSDYE